MKADRTPTIEIVALSPGHWEALSDLHAQFYGVKRDQRFWDWKYLQRPESSYSSAVALANGSIIGQVSAVNYRARIAGSPAMTYQTQDILILQQYRKGRIFFKMEKAARTWMSQKGNIVLDYGFSIEITRKVATRALEFRDIARIPKLVQVWGLQPYLDLKTKRRLPTRFIAACLNPLLRLRNKRAKSALRNGWKIETITMFDSRFDRLWQTCKDEYPVSMVRDALYLNWRYHENPVQSVTTFAVTDKVDEILGLIVVEVKEHLRDFSTLDFEVSTARRGEILDYLVAPVPDRELILTTLIAAAQNYLIDSHVDVISCWAFPHMPIYKMLEDLGFAVRQTPHNLIVRIGNDRFPGIEKALEVSNWYVTHGDKDHF